MPERKCGAPPRRFEQGGRDWIETCARPGRLWDASKGGHTEQLERCDEHAAQLRARGYDVRIADAAKKPKWDLTSTNSVEAAAGYLRKNSGALMVIVIRAGDAVVAVDQGIRAADVQAMLEVGLDEAVERLTKAQAEEREKKVATQIRGGVNPEEQRYA